jgi:hypothetical protein
MHHSLATLSTHYSPGPGHSCHTSNTRYRLLKAHLAHQLLGTYSEYSISHTPLASHLQHSSHTSSWSPTTFYHTPAHSYQEYSSHTGSWSQKLLFMHSNHDTSTLGHSRVSGSATASASALSDFHALHQHTFQYQDMHS